MGFNFEKIMEKIRKRQEMSPEEIMKIERKIMEKKRLQRKKEFLKLLEKKYGFKFDDKETENRD